MSPETTYTSQKKTFDLKSGPFTVNNYDDNYYGIESLRTATATSDNSVFAELGLNVGHPQDRAHGPSHGPTHQGLHQPGHDPGGLAEGVTPLEMAYAYSTIANKGERRSGRLAPDGEGPGGHRVGQGPRHRRREQDDVAARVPGAGGRERAGAARGVISSGTGKAAQIAEFAFGKTGTTENYGDAWFVGSNKELTVAVWVGYPDRLTAMETEYHGGPVAGGTFPAEIWHDLMTAWIGIRDQRILDRGGSTEDESTTTTPILPSGPATTTPAPEGEGTAPDGRRQGRFGHRGHAIRRPGGARAAPGGPHAHSAQHAARGTRAHARSGRWRYGERRRRRGARRLVRPRGPGASRRAGAATRGGWPRRHSAREAPPPW